VCVISSASHNHGRLKLAVTGQESCMCDMYTCYR